MLILMLPLLKVAYNASDNWNCIDQKYFQSEWMYVISEMLSIQGIRKIVATISFLFVI